MKYTIQLEIYVENDNTYFICIGDKIYKTNRYGTNQPIKDGDDPTNGDPKYAKLSVADIKSKLSPNIKDVISNRFIEFISY